MHTVEKRMKMKRGLAGMLAGMALLLAVGVNTAVAEEASPNVNRLPSPYPTGNARLDNSHTGELFADLMGTSITVQREFRRALPSIYSYTQTAHYQDRADIGSAGGYASGLVSTSYGACPTTMCSPGSKWVMWDVPFAVKDTKKRKDGYLGYEQTISGFATGISRLIGESSAIGLAVGYDYRKFDGRDDYHMKNRADAFHAALYGGTNIGSFFLDGYAGYSRTWNRTHRSAYDNAAGTDYEQLGGNYCDTILSAGVKASYVWIFSNDVRITPSIGVDYSHVSTGKFTEKSVATVNAIQHAALRVDKNSYDSVAVPIMVSLNKTFSANFLTFGGSESLWTPEVRAGYVPQFGSKRARADVAFVGGPAAGEKFSSLSTSMTDDYGTVGAGVKIKIRDKYIFALDYDYSFASKYTNHSLTAMYGVSF